MEARAKLFGHPIHQMLIVFPLGLLATAAIFDVICLVTDNGKWSDIAFWMIAAGVVGGLVAALFGFALRTAVTHEGFSLTHLGWALSLPAVTLLAWALCLPALYILWATRQPGLGAAQRCESARHACRRGSVRP